VVGWDNDGELLYMALWSPVFVSKPNFSIIEEKQENNKRSQD
jgi:hypothetical protein